MILCVHIHICKQPSLSLSLSVTLSLSLHFLVFLHASALFPGHTNISTDEYIKGVNANNGAMHMCVKAQSLFESSYATEAKQHS